MGTLPPKIHQISKFKPLPKFSTIRYTVHLQYCLLLYSVDGRVIHLAIYKKGNYCGPLTNERFPSIDSVIAHYSRTGFITEENIPVKLTIQLIPDK